MINMEKTDTIGTIEKIGIIPVIKIDDAQNAVPLARALADGGIPCVEITFRTSAGEESIRRIAREVPGILVGAGTVLSIAQADRAISAGAQFIVSPGLNPSVVAHCIEKGVPIIPGCSNPSDIERAMEFGLDRVKFFPAEQAGGLEYIRAISEPYPSVKFIPSGGINGQNIRRYIAFEKILACGGSWMAPAELINTGNFEKISMLAREAVLNMLGLYPVHIGINAGTEEAAVKAANFLSSVFGFSLKDGTVSVFAGDGIELMKQQGTGTHGHIAMGTASILRAQAYMERCGLELDYHNARKDSKGNISLIYLKEEILGFAVHLVQYNSV